MKVPIQQCKTTASKSAAFKIKAYISISTYSYSYSAKSGENVCVTFCYLRYYQFVNDASVLRVYLLVEVKFLHLS